MKLNLYEIGQYTDSKQFYISRLAEVNEYGTVKRVIVMDNIQTRKAAREWLASYNEQGLRPANKPQNETQKQFVDYVLSFYGEGGLYSDAFKKPVTVERITQALAKLLMRPKHDFAGDSFDRELVRDIMLRGEGVTDTEYNVEA